MSTDNSSRLVFVISAPRSGSTLLTRMLEGHPGLVSRAEPHLLTPLAHLGYFDRADRAPYDVVQSAHAARDLVADLPRGSHDYLDAVRAYSDTLYAALLKDRPGDTRFVDKTPAYALILPFVARLYPDAQYVVLTRHPCAVWDSYATSFFEGNYGAAHAFNPILERYVPAIASFLRSPPVPLHHVRYEDLVADPDRELASIFEHLGLEHEPGAVDYGGRPTNVAGGLGDPLGVKRHQRPVTSSVDRWACAATADPGKERFLREVVGRLDRRDLEAWGYDFDTLFAPLTGLDPAASARQVRDRARADRWDRFRVQRRALLWLRRDVHDRPHGPLLRRLREVLDILLRGGPQGGWGREADRRFGERSDD